MAQLFRQCIIDDHIHSIIDELDLTQHTIITGEDMLLALYSWSKNHNPDMMHILRKLVGVKSISRFFDIIEQSARIRHDHMIWDVALVQIADKSIRCTDDLYRHQSDLVTQWLGYVDCFTLWYAAIQSLDQQTIRILQSHKISVKTIISQTRRLSEHKLLLESGCFAFLKIVSTIMDRLSLTLDDISLMTITSSQDIKTLIQAFGVESQQVFLQDTDGRLLPHNSYESDVIDAEKQDDETNTSKKDKKEKAKKLTVEVFGTDLTHEAKEKSLDPVIGRKKEIDQIVFTLLRKTKSNPLLIGEAGVGKTAVVEWLAQKIVAGDVPMKLKDKRIIMLDIASMVAGTKYRGDFEARFKAVMEEATDPTNNIILFIDEIHTMIGAGWASGTDDAAQLIKPLLARGKLKLIAATTFDEYQQHIEKDAALKRRFQEVHIDEPNLEDTKTILLWLKSNFEDFHNVRITDESIDSAIKFAQRYILNKHFPDKAIDIIDEASARASTLTTLIEQDEHHQSVHTDVEKLHKQIQKAIAEQDYFLAAELKLKEKALKEKLRTIRSSKVLPLHLRPVVDVSEIGQVLADKTGVPTSVVTESEITKLKRLDEHLKQHIVGQDEAVQAVVKTIQRSRLSAVERERPIASYLFLWPSGVGKTYLAKLIAKQYFGDEKAMIRVDMSEFMESHNVSKLIGSAPGYVGYESGWLLTEQVRRKPYSVILLDEIEKANRDVLNILLQILDEWHIKDNKWRLISFKSTIIVMTSNLGAEEFGKKITSIWFAQNTSQDGYSDKDRDTIKSKVNEHVKGFISPELQNRIDYSIIFKPLSKDMMKTIFTQKLDEFLKIRATKNNITPPTFTNKKITAIIDEIYNPQFGARPIDKYIYDTIEPELIEQIMHQDTASQHTEE